MKVPRACLRPTSHMGHGLSAVLAEARMAKAMVTLQSDELLFVVDVFNADNTVAGDLHGCLLNSKNKLADCSETEKAW